MFFASKFVSFWRLKLIYTHSNSVENIIRTRSIYLFQSKCPEHNLLPKPDELPVFIEDSGEGGNGSKGNRSGRDGKGGVRWNG